MKRIIALTACLVAAALILGACGGGEAGTGGGSGSGTVTGGASGIKDAALIGKWVSADGGTTYDFKEDFSAEFTNVGSLFKTAYNILEGGNGQGKLEIVEDTTRVVWDYKITDNRLELTTPEGRSRRLTKQ